MLVSIHSVAQQLRTEMSILQQCWASSLLYAPHPPPLSVAVTATCCHTFAANVTGETIHAIYARKGMRLDD